MSLTVFRFKNLSLIISRHKAVTLLMIAFTAIILSIFGKLTVKADQTHMSARRFEETYGNKTYYYTGETLNDNLFYDYRAGDSRGLYYKLTELDRLMHESDRFTFIELTDQPVVIFSPEIPEIFFDGYEIGTPSKPFYGNGRLYQSVKSIQVSESFFREFDVGISSGDAFIEDEYYHQTGDPIPVLLGWEYKSLFSEGDVLDGYYFEDCTFIVKGFISEKSFFYTQSGMISCSRYIILPAVTFETEGEAARLSMLQKVSGIISSSIGYEETAAIFERCMEQTGLKKSEIYFSYPEANKNGFSLLEQYSAMTNEVARQLTVMVVVIMLFGTIAAAITLCSMLRENRQNFGIEMLCGATRRDVFSIAIMFLLTVLLAGDVLSLVFAVKAFLVIQITVFCMLLLSSSIAAVYIKKMDMHDIIGGNE